MVNIHIVSHFSQGHCEENTVFGYPFIGGIYIQCYDKKENFIEQQNVTINDVEFEKNIKYS